MDFYDDILRFYDELNNDIHDDISDNDDCMHKNVKKACEEPNKHNFNRDKRGRLLIGSKIAKKENCNEDKIWLMYCSGMRVKDIVKLLNCSKSTVYNVIKKRKLEMEVYEN